MGEPIAITAIIVGGLVTGLVAAFGIVVHYGFKSWQTERILQHDEELDGPRPDWFKPADLN